ncbi:Uncharacterised protein [Enterobacter roggenkampii]|nr:Uncharacterised protein [Enterobacter roggenkampii]
MVNHSELILVMVLTLMCEGYIGTLKHGGAATIDHLHTQADIIKLKVALNFRMPESDRQELQALLVCPFRNRYRRWRGGAIQKHITHFCSGCWPYVCIRSRFEIIKIGLVNDAHSLRFERCQRDTRQLQLN